MCQGEHVTWNKSTAILISQPTGHNCCDSCAVLYTCNNGTCTYDLVWAPPVMSTPTTRSPVRQVSDKQVHPEKRTSFVQENNGLHLYG